MSPSDIETELPRAQVKRLAKLALQKQSNSDKDFTVSKDALLALSESTKIFIHYLTATANDICKASKRQTISAKDVFEALSELDFDELEEPLREAMEGAHGIVSAFPSL
jgi:DNA polymerase epsilon subunit 3